MPLHVEVFTPEKLALTEDVEFIAAPTTEGEIGILPRHAPLLAKLGAGVLRLRNATETHVLAVTGGFLEVREGNHVAIFAETAEFANDIDLERARLAAERAKNEISQSAKTLTLDDLARLESSLSRALLRIKIAETGWRKQPPRQPNSQN